MLTFFINLYKGLRTQKNIGDPEENYIFSKMFDIYKNIFKDKPNDLDAQSFIGAAAITLCSLQKNDYSLSPIINMEKRRLSDELLTKFNWTIKYGPFAGLKFDKKSRWGQEDRGAMLLGIYEQEILNSFTDIPRCYTTFIDIGAADGYYAIGAIISKMFKHSYCFEISEEGQVIIGNNAIANRVSNNITIYGEATRDFYKNIPPNEINSSVLLIDIEGGEFNLLDENIFSTFKNSIIFIELHEWLLQDSTEKLDALKAKVIKYFSIKEFKMSSRDLSSFPEIDHWNDYERWLLCAEGRLRSMKWWRLDPLT